MLGPCVGTGADGAGGCFFGACLMWMAEAVTVSAMSGGVGGVNGGNSADPGKETNGGSDLGSLFLRNGDNY
jgi:hypothetical protein